MEAEDLGGAIQEFINEYLEPAGEAFVEELVYRFLLTKGDALGGQIRNLAGELGRRKFTTAVLSALAIREIEFDYLRSGSRTWAHSPAGNADIESDLKAVHWVRDRKERTAVYNIKVPLVRKQIDIVLLKCDGPRFRVSINNPRDYIALGELKGGIDPAGADEHWKTARTALSRIRTEFSKEELNPRTLFVGAAIVNEMAAEIWEQLRTRTLSNAANLTDPDQVASLCDWFTAL